MGAALPPTRAALSAANGRSDSALSSAIGPGNNLHVRTGNRIEKKEQQHGNTHDHGTEDNPKRAANGERGAAVGGEGGF